MQLADAAAIATVVALLILAYVHAKPAMNRWATVKFLRIYSELHWDDLLTREQARELPWPRRLRRWRRDRTFRLVQRLMTRAHRIAQHALLQQLRAALDRSEFLPGPPGCDPLVAEAATVAKHEHKKRQARHRARVHRSVVCAGGCGTRYGKRRKDHNFTGGSGVEGGWYCPTNVSCLDEPIGEHYCGMCDRETRHSTVGQYTEQARDPTTSSEDVETAIAEDQDTPEATAGRASEYDGDEFAPTPEEQGVVRPPTEGSDETPAQAPGRNTPEPATVG